MRLDVTACCCYTKIMKQITIDQALMNIYDRNDDEANYALKCIEWWHDNRSRKIKGLAALLDAGHSVAVRAGKKRADHRLMINGEELPWEVLDDAGRMPTRWITASQLRELGYIS